MNSVSVWAGDGAGTFGDRTDSLTAAGPLSVAVADLNADAVPDLVTSTFANGLAVWLGQGRGPSGRERIS